MHILITRPEPDASEMQAELQSLGHEVSIDPVMRIEPLPIAAEALHGAQALVATSRNAIRALSQSAARTTALALPLFAVGPGTAALARAEGFTQVIAGDGGARELPPLIAAMADPAKGPLVHIAGAVLAFDLVSALSAAGYDAHKLIAYQAVAATSLAPPTLARISRGEIDAVVLMSPRAAATFAQLLRKAGGGLLEGAEMTSKEALINQCASRLTYLCLSRSVAEALGSPAPGRIEIAATPNSAAMLAAIARVATKSSGV